MASQVDLTEQTVSLASLCYGRHMLLFSLSRGGRLRIWNLISHVCIKSLSSLGSARDSSSILVYPSQPHKYIQVFNEQESFGHGTDSGFGFEEQAASFCLALYSPLSTDGETRDPGLQVYFARIDAMAQLRDFSLVLEKRGLDDQDVKLDDASLSTMHLGGSEETFVDFIVESVSSSSSSLPDSSRPDWTVWTLWNKGRQAVVRYTALALPGSRIDFGISSRWIETSSNLTDITMTPFVPTSEATSLSVQEQVLEYVFRPGQFSFETIKKALEAVSPSPTSAHRNTGILTWSDLQAQVVSFIGSQIVVPADAPDKFVAFNESLVAEYNRFLSFCWQFDRQERIPSCLAFFGSDKCVIQRCGWASLREMDPPRAILSQDPLLLNASPALLHSLGWTAELCRKEFISDLSLFHDLSDSLALFLVPEKRAAFDFYEFGRLLESLDMSVADYSELLRMRYLSDIEGHPDTIQSICGLYTSMRHPQVFFRTLLQIVLQGGQDLDSLQVQVEAQPSMMSERALSQSVAELIRSRHKLASSLLLVVLVVSHLQVPASHKVPALIVAETVAAFHSLCVLHLLAAKRIEARANQSASILSRMSELSVDVTESKQFTASTLLSHLIQHHYLTRTANGLSSDSLTLVASDWISLLSVSPYPPSKSIRMTEAVLKLSNKLIAFGHTQIALDVLDLYPKTAGACFLLGQIWMDKIDFEKARRYFEQAALGLGELSN